MALHSLLHEAASKDQLTELMNHIAKMSQSTSGNHAGGSGAKSSTSGETQSTYTGSQSTNDGRMCGSSGHGSSGHGSGSGSGSGHGSGSGSGQGSGAGSGKGSGSGGSDGYCGSGENSSESSGSSGNEDQQEQAVSSRLSSLGMPMKVQLGGSNKRSGNHREQQAKAPNMSSPASLTSLLEEVLRHMADNFPPEDTVAVCTALAKSLASVLMRNASEPPMPCASHEQHVVQFLQQELGRQRMLHQELEKQHMQQQMKQLVQQELEKQELERQLMVQASSNVLKTPTFETALQIANAAAQQIAVAWQQQQQQQPHQQQSAALRQQERMAWQHDASFQQTMESSMVDGSVASAYTSMTPAPFLPPYLAGYPAEDLSWPPHMKESHMPLPAHLASTFSRPQMLNGHCHSNAQSGLQAFQAPTYVSKNDVNNGGDKGVGRSKGASKGGQQSRNGQAGASRGKAGKAVAPGTGGSKSAKDQATAGGRTDAAAARAAASSESLRGNLEALHAVEAKRIIITRKINRLGFESAQIIQNHFSQYGNVEQVLVSHSRAKSGNIHFRPASLGFLVMSTKEAAQAILADGPEFRVEREAHAEPVVVVVQPFERLGVENLEEAGQ